MIDQISSDLHVVGIKLNTSQPRVVYNDINMRIMIELSTKDGQFQLFFILYLVFLSDGKYILNQI